MSVLEMNRNLNRVCELLVLELSKEFGFSLEEGMKHLGLVLEGSESVGSRGVGKVGCKVGCEKKKRKKCIPLPWTGKVREENCRALEYNNGLFTQCGSKKEMGKDYCVNCIKRQEENNGELEYGTVEDRMKKEFEGKGGKGVIPYGNVLKKKKISREEAEKAGREEGIEIPEKEFEVVVRKRGRPKKVSTSVEDTPEKKNRGRPRKRNATVISEENPVDLIGNLAKMASVKSPVKSPEKLSVKSPVKLSVKSPEKLPEKLPEKSVELQEEEEEEDDDITVQEFTHKGIKYLRSAENVLYDSTTQDVVGVWDENTQTIMEAQEESDNES